MAEEKKPVEVTPTTPAAPATELTLVERAEAAQKGIEAANAESIKIAERLEAAKIKEALGGTTAAGQPDPKKETEDEKWEKEAKERWKGTGVDPTPDKPK